MTDGTIRIAHLADTHLGFSALTRLCPNTGRNQRAVDIEQSFAAAVDQIIAAGDVDLVVHAGDVFHHSRPPMQTLIFLVKQLRRLEAAGIPTVDHYRRDFQHEGHVDIAALERILGDLDDGVTELGCHPGEPDAELAATSTYASLRSDELATLTDERAKAAIARNRIALSDYTVLR